MEESITAGNDIERRSKLHARGFLEGDRQAFNRLILLHQRMVFSLCSRLMGDYDDANDCAQEVFIKVHRYLKGFRFESSFRTWLYRIAVNTCKNRLNSLEYRMRKKKLRIDPPPSAEENPFARELRDRGDSPLNGLRRKEIGRIIQEALNNLAPPQRMVVVLRDIEGRSYEEIVALTGLKPGTVKSKLSRARLALREALQGKIDHELS
ncbi:MAG: sigma-70 family RNA polymerase sigma factor [Candidatus Krumholzibacteriota bacterium]|nr:sigma-70 family RNA polymerase sigma factor [Candidatus Krumholzibacteriota bacterium]